MKSVSTRSERLSLRAGMVTACAVLAHGATMHPALAQCLPQEITNLFASDPGPGDFFGSHVAIDGETALIGASGDDNAGGTNAGAVYIFARTAGYWLQQTKLIASDAAVYDYFGSAVALSGNTAVIGALGGDAVSGANSGSAYVFVRVNGVWVQRAELTASDAATGDSFGGAVAISGNTVLVGAYTDRHGPGQGGGEYAYGSAYVFVRSGGIWTQQAKLIASDAMPGDLFGVSVALSGDTALIGAFGDTHEGGSNAGSAYVFVREGVVWTQRAKLTASDAAAGDLFGCSVALSNDTAVVGAYADDHMGAQNAGSAYVFVRDGDVWSEHTKLTAPEPETEDYFGSSVAVSGDTLMAGAIGTELPTGLRAGATYVFRRADGEWAERIRITASNGTAGDRFGNGVALSADTAIVGANGDARGDWDYAGSAYLFDLNCIPCLGDVDGDETVGLKDLGTLLTYIGIPAGAVSSQGDTDSDGDVDLNDLATLLGNFGTNCS